MSHHAQSVSFKGNMCRAVVAHTCSPSTGEAGAGTSLADILASQPQLVAQAYVPVRDTAS